MKTPELNAFIWTNKNALELTSDVKAHEYNSIQATTIHSKHTNPHQNIH